MKHLACAPFAFFNEIEGMNLPDHGETPDRKAHEITHTNNEGLPCNNW